MMAMFVQVFFWYGAKLVREKKIGAGDWACLKSQLAISGSVFSSLAKGKFAALLLHDVDSNLSSPASASSSSPKFLPSS